MSGFLYILSNDFLPELTKIGCSERHPDYRVQELSQSTAIPGPFKLEYFIEVTDVRGAEAAIHKYLDFLRVSPDREFFRCSVDEAIDAIVESALEYIPERARTSLPIQTIENYEKSPTEAFPKRCPSCGSILWYSYWTRHVGGHCTCGQLVSYVNRQDLGVSCSERVLRGPGVVLPRCKRCRRRTFIDEDSSIRCSSPACGFTFDKE